MDNVRNRYPVFFFFSSGHLQELGEVSALGPGCFQRREHRCRTGSASSRWKAAEHQGAARNPMAFCLLHPPSSSKFLATLILSSSGCLSNPSQPCRPFLFLKSRNGEASWPLDVSHDVLASLLLSTYYGTTQACKARLTGRIEYRSRAFLSPSMVSGFKS